MTASHPAPGAATGNQGLPVARTHRETTDVVAGIGRMIRAVAQRVAQEDTDSLAQLQALDAALADAWAVAVAGLRRTYSDPQIGRQLDISRQAVEKRWPRTHGA